VAPSGAANRQTVRRTTRPDERVSGPLAAPRFAAGIASAVYAAFTLLLAYPALAGQFLLSGRSDQFQAGYAFREYAASMLRAGQGFPQWNPYLFGGMPYVAAMHGDIFYPTFLLRMVLPTDVAMTWGFIIHVFLCGLFTYHFLRAWGLGFYPALIGGLAYMLSGQIASLVSPGHDGKLFVSALLPLTLWMLVRGVRDGRAWAWGVLALTIGLAVLSPHPQLLQYMLLASGAFALYVAFARRADGSRLDRPVALRRLGLALGAVLLGALIGAIQYWPVFGYVDWSPRAGGAGWEHAVSFSMPIEEAINTYLPQFSGILDAYWGRNRIHFHSEYLGAAVLVLATAAFGGSRTADRRGFRWFWLGTGFVALLWAFGGYTPFYHLVYALVPGAKFFRAPSIMFFVVSFSVATLAALGAERVLERGIGARFAIGWGIAALVIALLASLGLFYNLGQSIAASIPLDGIYEAVLANRAAVVTGAWRSFLFAGGAALLLYLLALGKGSRVLVAWGLVVVVGLDLWSIVRLYWNFSPPASITFASDPAIDYMRNADQPGRVIGAMIGGEGIVQPRDGALRYDLMMVHRVRVPTGYHGNELGRYRMLGGDETYPQLGNPNFWRLTNVRWLYTNASQMDSAFKRVLGPVRNAAGNTVYLYEVPGDNPFAWVTAATVKAPDEGLAATVLDDRFNPRRVAVFDTAAAVTATPLQGLPEPAATNVRVERYEPGHVVMELDRPATAGQSLIVSENFYPGWTATVDGKPAVVGRADYVLTGVQLPEGGRRVELRFDDPRYETGKRVTMIALAATLLAIAAGVVADRRRKVPHA